MDVPGVVKMMEKINNMGGSRVGSPVVLLERPFIRCPSCWAIYSSILLAMSLSYGLADRWAKEMGLSVCFLGGTGFIFFSGRLREDPTKPEASATTGQGEDCGAEP